MAQPLPHSLLRHPLKEMLSAEEWNELRRQVEYGEISWPVGIHLVARDEPEEQEHRDG